MPPHKKDSLLEELGEIFNDCQRSFGSHRRAQAAMQKLAAGHTQAFQQLLVVFKRDPHVERLVQLVTNFAKENVTFGIALLRHLLELSQAKEKAVRFRVCQFTSLLISNLPEDADVEEDLWDRVIGLMLLRTKDRIPIVRIQAIGALRRFQDPSDAADPVITELLRLMSGDLCKDVRKSALTNIHIGKSTLPGILERARDVKEDVRRAAFALLTEKVNVKHLSITQRRELLRDGLGAREESVREACRKMAQEKWLPQVGGDVRKLLALLDPCSDERAAEQLLLALLPHLPGVPAVKAADASATSPVPATAPATPSPPVWPPTWPAAGLAASTAEDALCLRVYAQWCAQRREAAALEQALPELTVMCDHVRAYVDAEEMDDFVLRQSLQLLGSAACDLADEAGRRSLTSTLKEILVSPFVSEEVASASVPALARCYMRSADFYSALLEIMSETKEPLDQVQSPEYRAALAREEQELRDSQAAQRQLEAELRRAERRGSDDAATLRERATAASQLTEQLQAKAKLRAECAESAWERCLTLAEAALQLPQGATPHPGLLDLLPLVVLPCIRAPAAARRRRGVVCLGLYGLLGSGQASSSMELLTKVLENDEEEVRDNALRALLDAVHTWGLEPLAAPALPATLLSALRGPTRLRTTAAVGLAKLLMLDRLPAAASTYAALLQQYVHPSTRHDDELRQALSVFWEAYPAASAAHWAVVREALPQALRPAPAAAQVLLAAALGGPMPTAPHASFALLLLTEILAAPAGPARQMTRALSVLRLGESEGGPIPKAEETAGLRLLTAELGKHALYADKPTARLVDRFALRLRMLPAPPAPPAAEARAEVDTGADAAAVLLGRVEDIRKERQQEKQAGDRKSSKPAARPKKPARRTAQSSSEEEDDSSEDDADESESFEDDGADSAEEAASGRPRAPAAEPKESQRAAALLAKAAAAGARAAQEARSSATAEAPALAKVVATVASAAALAATSAAAAPVRRVVQADDQDEEVDGSAAQQPTLEKQPAPPRTSVAHAATLAQGARGQPAVGKQAGDTRTQAPGPAARPAPEKLAKAAVRATAGEHKEEATRRKAEATRRLGEDISRLLSGSDEDEQVCIRRPATQGKTRPAPLKETAPGKPAGAEGAQSQQRLLREIELLLSDSE